MFDWDLNTPLINTHSITYILRLNCHERPAEKKSYYLVLPLCSDIMVLTPIFKVTLMGNVSEATVSDTGDLRKTYRCA